MSRRLKRIQALRSQFPTLDEDALRKKERSSFHKRSSKKRARKPKVRKQGRQLAHA